MPTGTLISVEEYLATSYEPDCDYVDGHLEQRNVGEWDHSKLQLAIGAYFFARRKQWGISAATELRVQVKPSRFRIPDVCVVLGEPNEQILTRPPFLCVEILSPDDPALELRIKIDEYLDFGVSYVWVIDPMALSGEMHTPRGIERVRDGRFRADRFEIDLAQF